MGYRLGAFADVGLSEGLLAALVSEHSGREAARLRGLWTYYRNPMEVRAGSMAMRRWGRWYRQGQEAGLPGRLSGERGDGPREDDRTPGNREIVVENDIAWRVHTMVDFMFGRPVKFRAAGASGARAAAIEAALAGVWEASGGIGLMQDVALLGHVYGHVDLLVTRGDGESWGGVRVEVIEPTRGIPLLNERDFRGIDAYIVRFERESRGVVPAEGDGGPARGRVTVVHVLSGAASQTYEDDGNGVRLVDERRNTVSPGRTPVVHIQNQSQPFSYSGLGEVEALIPLQDELNTRLSDRASRVTMQSFRMYLAKGIEGFLGVPVAPGQVWSTDNPEASIESFGGDASSPSEESHIEQIREAMDKVSGVPPLATGVVRARVGNLSSESALRLTLTGLLSKTERKRVTYGRGLAEVCGLVLAALDGAGVLATEEAERAVEVEWPEILARDEESALRVAEAKVRLGVSPAAALAGLGYPGAGE